MFFFDPCGADGGFGFLVGEKFGRGFFSKGIYLVRQGRAGQGLVSWSWSWIIGMGACVPAFAWFFCGLWEGRGCEIWRRGKKCYTE